MTCSTLYVLLAILITQVCTAPQFITFKDGKLGVNIAGFHAGIGIGAALNGSDTSGGLYAEAGTPFGHTAKAGVGGLMDKAGGVAGRVFAEASGGEKLKASAGLSGGVTGGKTFGGGFATARAGDRLAFTRMNGETRVRVEDEQPLEVKPIQEKDTVNMDSINEVKPLELNNEDLTKVYVEQQPQVVETRTIYTRNTPRRHNFRKTAFLGGHIGPGGEIIPPPVEAKQVSQRKVDDDAEATVNGETIVNGDVGHTTETKLVTYQKNPTFFQDIFNIPISALKAVGSLLSNTASNTKVTVEKAGTVKAEDSDSISVKSDPSSVSSSSAHISVETPSASKFINDIFAIPINTLSAVNKFLENNVAGRKSIQIQREGGEPTRVKLGPLARRRANKQVVIVQEAEKEIVAEA